MSELARLAELDDWLHTADEAIAGIETLELDQFSMVSPQTDVLNHLCRALTVLRNIVVDNLVSETRR